jgi:hypothetical protein
VLSLNVVDGGLKLARTPRPDYQKPFYWWGDAWQPPTPATLPALVAGKMLTPENAAFLVDALNSGKSLAVVSDASGVGKSTLLWALAAQVRGDLPRIYIRGQYEPFAFAQLAEPQSPSALLMINEISPHLPVYCWGRVRDRLFGPEFAHFQKIATAHAPSAEAFFSGWCSWPGTGHIGVSRPFDIAVFLNSEDRDRSWSKVNEIRTLD